MSAEQFSDFLSELFDEDDADDVNLFEQKKEATARLIAEVDELISSDANETSPNLASSSRLDEHSASKARPNTSDGEKSASHGFREEFEMRSRNLRDQDSEFIELPGHDNDVEMDDNGDTGGDDDTTGIKATPTVQRLKINLKPSSKPKNKMDERLDKLNLKPYVGENELTKISSEYDVRIQLPDRTEHLNTLPEITQCALLLRLQDAWKDRNRVSMVCHLFEDSLDGVKHNDQDYCIGTKAIGKKANGSVWPDEKMDRACEACKAPVTKRPCIIVRKNQKDIKNHLLILPLPAEVRTTDRYKCVGYWMVPQNDQQRQMAADAANAN